MPAGLSAQLLSGCITAAFTIVGGVSVLALGQIALKFFVEPIQEQAKTRGEIAYWIVYYANIYTNPGERTQERDCCADTLRQQASRLRASTWRIRWYSAWRLLGFVPKRSDALKASECLIGLSNMTYQGDPIAIHERQQEVYKLLRLR